MKKYSALLCSATALAFIGIAQPAAAQTMPPSGSGGAGGPGSGGAGGPAAATNCSLTPQVITNWQTVSLYPNGPGTQLDDFAVYFSYTTAGANSASATTSKDQGTVAPATDFDSEVAAQIAIGEDALHMAGCSTITENPTVIISND